MEDAQQISNVLQGKFVLEVTAKECNVHQMSIVTEANAPTIIA